MAYVGDILVVFEAAGAPNFRRLYRTKDQTGKRGKNMATNGEAVQPQLLFIKANNLGASMGLLVYLFIYLFSHTLTEAFKAYAGQKKSKSRPRGLSHLSRPP
jgi:hypothetical protein